MGEPGPPAADAERLCQITEAFLQRCGGTLAGLHLVEREGTCLAACAALDLPGSVSLVMVPAWSAAGCPGNLLAQMLSLAGERAQTRGARFAQMLLEPELSETIRPALERAGYTFLAELRYMQRAAFDPVALQQDAVVTWLTLNDTDESRFAEIIRRTYIDSRDCPGLTGIRSMEEVLAAHKGAGEFDPGGWYMLVQQDRPAGVVLTARTPFRDALELVYMGLVPEARGRGLGRLLVRQAIQRARDLALSSVTLAVDAANQRAGRLYESMGFVGVASRCAWIKVFRRADSQGAFSTPAE